MKPSLLAALGLGVLLAIPARAQQPQASPPPDQQPEEEKPPTFEEVVVVTGSKVEQRLIDAPATMSVITPETIAASPAQNYGDLVRNVPGVNVIQMSARDVNLTSRAATATLATSTLALLDGRTIYLDFFGLILWDFVPASTSEIKQIEVVRGPASAVWGANALNGVVNIITKTPREAVGANLILTGGTFSRDAGSRADEGNGESYGASASVARAPNDRWSYKVSGGYYHADPFSRPTGTIPVRMHPLDSRIRLGGERYPADTPGQVGAFENQGTTQPKFDLRVDQDMSDGGRVIYGAGIAGTEGIVHTGIGPFDLQSGSVLGYGKVNYSKGALKINVFANILDGEAPNLLAIDPLTRRPIQLDFKTQTYDLELGHSKVFSSAANPSRGHILTYGGNVRRNNFDITLAPEAEDRTELGAYFQDEIFFDRFRISLGARVDKFGNIDDAVFSPRVTVMYKATPSHAFRLSYNKAFRSPSVINNYLNQPFVQPVDLSGLAPLLPPPLRPLVAQPFPLFVRAVGSELSLPGRQREALKEESLNAYEVSYTGTFAGKTTLGLAFYINDTDDNINFVATPGTGPLNVPFYTDANPPPGWMLPPGILTLLAQQGIRFPSHLTYFNLGTLRNKGVEVSLDHTFNNNVSGFANYSWQDDPEPRDPVGSPQRYPTEEIGLPPTNRFNVGLNYDDKRFVGSLSLNYADEALWVDVLTSGFQGFTDSYTMLNASFGVKWANGKVTTSIKGTNLTNEDIQQHVFGDIIKRSILGEVRVSFK